MTNKNSIGKRIAENKKAVLEQLQKLPIVQVACQKSGISRATYYRWRNDSKKFSKEANEAIAEGIEVLNDLSETQLISAIKNQNFSAIRFWLQNRHKAYTTKVEVTERGMSDNQDLTEEQKKIVKEALKLASVNPQDNEKGESEKPRPNNPSTVK